MQNLKGFGDNENYLTSLENYLANYQIIEEIGRGGMGIVYKIREIASGRMLALKVLNVDDFDINEKSYSRFLNEINISSVLDHPNIIKSYNAGIHGRYVYLIMEYIEGQTLLEYAEKVSLRKKIKVVQKIADALSYAHKKGIIHRDIKPDNIIVKLNDEPVLMDFGLAKNIKENFRITKQGDIVGTPKYMSPEQAKGGKVDLRTDIYSLGTVMFRLLAGKDMVQGKHHMEIFYNITNHQPDVSDLQLIPNRFKKICLKAVSKNKRERYQSMKEMSNDLKNALLHRRIWKVPFYVVLVMVLISSVFWGLYWKQTSTTQDDSLRLDLLTLSFNSYKSNPNIENTLRYIETQIVYERYQEAFENIQSVENILHITRISFWNKKQDLFYTRYRQVFAALEELKIWCLVEQKNYEQAVKIFETAKISSLDLHIEDISELTNGEQRLYVNIVEAYYYQACAELNHEVVISNLKKLIEKNLSSKTKEKALFYLGQIHLKHKKYKEARQYFTTLQSDYKNKNRESLLLYYIAICCFHQGEYDRSIEIFQEHNNLPDAHYYIGKSYLGKLQRGSLTKEEKKQMCESFSEAIKRQPVNEQYYLDYGKALQLLERYNEADYVYRQALEIDHSQLEAFEQIMKLPLSDVTFLRSRFAFILAYARKPQRVFLFRDIAIQIADKYHEVDIIVERLDKAQEQEILKFLKKIKDKTFLNVHAEKLITMRYSTSLDNNLEAIIRNNTYSKLFKQHLQKTLKSIQNLRKYEKHQQLRYIVSRLFFSEELELKQRFLDFDIQKIKEALSAENTEENLYIKIFIVRALLLTHQFEFVHNLYQHDPDILLRSICYFALRDCQFPIQDETLCDRLEEHLVHNQFTDEMTVYFVKKILRFSSKSSSSTLKRLGNLIQSSSIKARRQAVVSLMKHISRHPELESEYFEELKIIMQDNEILKSCLWCFPKSYIEKYERELFTIFKQEANKKVGDIDLLAMTSSVLVNPAYTKEIIHGDFPLVVRLSLLIKDIFGIFNDFKTTQNFSADPRTLQVISQLHSHLLMLYKDKDKNIKMMAFAMAALFGLLPHNMFDHIKKADEEMKTYMLLALMLPCFREMANDLQKNCYRRLKEEGLLAEMRKSQNSTLPEISYTTEVLLNLEKQQEIYQEAIISPENDRRSGTALGFYYSVWYIAWKQLPVGEDKQNGEDYNLYVHTLLDIIQQQPELRDHVLKNLEYAKNLKRDTSYLIFNEMAAIYLQEGNLQLAKGVLLEWQNIKQKHTSDSPLYSLYTGEQDIEFLLLQKQVLGKWEFSPEEHQRLGNSKNRVELLEAGKVFLQHQYFELAEFCFQRLCLLPPRLSTRYLHYKLLEDIYRRQGKHKLADRYLDYYNFMNKR